MPHSGGYDEIYSRLVVALGNRRQAETYFWHDRRSDNTDEEVPAAAQEPAPLSTSLPVPNRSPAAPGSNARSPNPETEEAPAAA